MFLPHCLHVKLQPDMHFDDISRRIMPWVDWSYGVILSTNANKMAANHQMVKKVGVCPGKLILLAETNTFCRIYPHQSVLEVSEIIFHA